MGFWGIVADSFDLGDDRIAPFDSHDLVRQGVELLHPALLQQVREVVEVLRGIDLPCYLEFLLLLVDLLLRSVSDAHGTSPSPFFLSPHPLLNFLHHSLIVDIVVRWLVDHPLGGHHVQSRLFEVDQSPQVTLRQ